MAQTNGGKKIWPAVRLALQTIVVKYTSPSVISYSVSSVPESCTGLCGNSVDLLPVATPGELRDFCVQDPRRVAAMEPVSRAQDSDHLLPSRQVGVCPATLYLP